MKCLRCARETHRQTNGKPLCLNCKERLRVDKESVRALGYFALPEILFRGIFARTFRFVLTAREWISRKLYSKPLP
jgi:hypothetical protein